MKIFVSGGCKNGKSFYAQHLAKDAACSAGVSIPLYYVATMRPADCEDEARIKRHIDERAGWGFITIEQHNKIEEIIDKCDNDGSFLLDSLTALLADEMFSPDGSVDELGVQRVIDGVEKVLTKVNTIVVVSDYIYSDAIIYDPLTENYRKGLAAIDKAAAKMCDVVLEVSFAKVIVHKGAELFTLGDL